MNSDSLNKIRIILLGLKPCSITRFDIYWLTDTQKPEVTVCTCSIHLCRNTTQTYWEQIKILTVIKTLIVFLELKVFLTDKKSCWSICRSSVFHMSNNKTNNQRVTYDHSVSRRNPLNVCSSEVTEKVAHNPEPFMRRRCSGRYRDKHNYWLCLTSEPW